MKRLFMIANRLPWSIIKKEGQKELEVLKGNFDSGLKRFYESFDIKWIGRAGLNINEISEVEKQEIDNQFRLHNCIPIYLDKQLRDDFIYGFCDNTVWLLFNYYNQMAKFKPEHWEVYKKSKSIVCRNHFKIYNRRRFFVDS